LSAGRAGDAYKFCLRAAASSPLDAPWALILAARARLESRRPREALRVLDRARRLGPETAARLWLECYALDALGRRKASRERAHRAMRLYPEQGFEVLLGSAAVRESRRGAVDERTLRVLDRALARGRDREWILAIRAESLRREEFLRYPEAARDLARAAKLAPQCAWIHARLGRALSGLGDPQGAGRALDRAAALAPDCGWIASWRGHFKARGKLKGALTEMRRGARLDSSYPFGQAWLGGALRRAGKLAEAEVRLRLSLRVLPEYEWTHYELHRVLWGQGKWSEAARSLTRSFERDPKFVWCRPGDAEGVKRALGELRAARRRLPGDPWLKAWLARTLLGERRVAEAVVALGAEVPGEPVFLRGVRGEAALASGEAARALTFLESAVAEGGTTYQGARGLARLAAGDARGAARDLERACALHSAWVSHLKALAQAEALLGHDAAALRALERALNLDPSDGEALRWRGAAYLLKGRYSCALADFETALARHPDDPQARQGAEAARSALAGAARA
jgi:tetratricopeptide (TPR) repeat protein